jgi:hypothetical protein
MLQDTLGWPSSLGTQMWVFSRGILPASYKVNWNLGVGMTGLLSRLGLEMCLVLRMLLLRGCYLTQHFAYLVYLTVGLRRS